MTGQRPYHGSLRLCPVSAHSRSHNMHALTHNVHTYTHTHTGHDGTEDGDRDIGLRGVIGV